MIGTQFAVGFELSAKFTGEYEQIRKNSLHCRDPVNNLESYLNLYDNWGFTSNAELPMIAL